MIYLILFSMVSEKLVAMKKNINLPLNGRGEIFFTGFDHYHLTDSMESTKTKGKVIYGRNMEQEGKRKEKKAKQKG